MTGATKRPWYATGIHVQSAAINEDNYVCTAEGNSPEQAIANADLIVKAVNSHDALLKWATWAYWGLVYGMEAGDSHDLPNEFTATLEKIHMEDKFV